MARGQIATHCQATVHREGPVAGGRAPVASPHIGRRARGGGSSWVRHTRPAQGLRRAGFGSDIHVVGRRATHGLSDCSRGMSAVEAAAALLGPALRV